MPLFREGWSRRSWRRQVAAWIADRVDGAGSACFYGTTREDRREMLRVARLLPPGFIAEIYEDPYDRRGTVMEVRAEAAPVAFDRGFRILPPEETERREAAGW